jgi:hypothetical protein
LHLPLWLDKPSAELGGGMLENRDMSCLKPLLGALLIALIFVSTALLRSQGWRDGVGERNLEASYHVLLTLEAIDRSAASNHMFLPTVSLAQLRDKGVTWGSTVPTKTGDLIYTSFLSSGFLLPYAVLKAVGASFTLRNLAIFNATLGMMAAVFFFTLAYRVARLLAPVRKQNVRDAVLATLPLIWSTQALLSTGLVYWHQNVYQLILIAICHSLLSVLTKNTKNSRAILIISSFSGIFFDWTAFLVNAGLIFALERKVFLGERHRALALWIAAATILAIGIIIAHFSLAISPEAYLETSARRLRARSVTLRPYMLLIGYFLSYSTFLIVLALAVRPAWSTLEKSKNLAGARAVKCMLLILVAASCENIVLLQHATQFSFDRFKFAILMGVVFVIAMQQLAATARRLMIAGLLASSAVGGAIYLYDLYSYRGWAEAYRHNLALRAKIDSWVDRKCALFASDRAVRGYTNLWLDRAVYEEISPREFDDLSPLGGRCGAVYLRSKQVAPDLYEYRLARIVPRETS